VFENDLVELDAAATLAAAEANEHTLTTAETPRSSKPTRPAPNNKPPQPQLSGSCGWAAHPNTA
jgi:hypothetical protein